ncbi:MAG: hypothetical protein HOH74_26320, partial [Gemmatimonadetes bacterium]|nr:hypothetical protein [Gemmatimonadota bacterium]
EPLATMMWRNRPDSRSFDSLILQANQMYATGRAPYPIERTLLVSGVLDLLLESRIEGHRRIETPELDVAYTVDDRSFHVSVDSMAPWGAAPAADG